MNSYAHRRTAATTVQELTLPQVIQTLLIWGLPPSALAEMLTASAPGLPVTAETVQNWAAEDESHFLVDYVDRLLLLIYARAVLTEHPSYVDDASALEAAQDSLAPQNLNFYLRRTDPQPAKELLQIISIRKELRSA